MKYISCGKFNKKLLFILIGGIGKLLSSLILFLVKDESRMNQHCFIIGINSGFGMMIAFIPDIILKQKSKKRNKSILQEKELLANDAYSESIKNQNNNRLSKKRLKIIIILICSILDYIQKMLAFVYTKYFINNPWLFDIVFLTLFSYKILGLKLYSHQYITSFIMIIFGIVLNAIHAEYNVTLIYKLLLTVFDEMCFNLAIVLAKYGMDNLFITPYQITYFEGLFCFVINVISISISTNVEIVNPPLIVRLMKSCTYKGKIYVDNFWSFMEEFKYMEIFYFFVQLFGRAFFNLFSHIIAKDFTPIHVIFLLMIGEIVLAFDSKSPGIIVVNLVVIISVIFLLLVFTEIIELHFCGLDRNTKKNINAREANVNDFDAHSDDSGIELEGNLIPLNEDDIDEN